MASNSSGVTGMRIRYHGLVANNDYPDLPQASPAFVPAVRLLQRGLPDQTPLLYALLGSGTPPYKMSPADATYVSSAPMSRMTYGNCVRAYQHVTSKTFICDQIRGEIQPSAWCRLWKGA